MRSRSGLSHAQLDRLRMLEQSNAKIRKAYTQPTGGGAAGTTGLRFYDLRRPAIRFNPITSTLRNRIPRNPSPGGTGLHWKQITGINTGNILPGVSEGNRNAVITQTTADYFQPYAGLGYEDYVSFEGRYAGRPFADVQALARLDALETLMNAEERIILAGNNSNAFGVPGTPSGTIVATGGALTAQAWICYVVALTFEGMQLASVAGGVATTFVRTNADGSTDNIAGGSSNKSLPSVATAATAGANSLLWVCPSKPGAAGYAWYVGISTGGAAGATLAAITTINEFYQTTNPAGTQNASVVTADNSANPLVFDGVITQIAKNASATGSYVGSVNGGQLTVSTAGTINAFDPMFSQMWNNLRTGPSTLLMNAVTRNHLTSQVLKSGASPSPNIQITVQMGANGIKTGMVVQAVLNPYTGNFVDIENHFFMPTGMILAFTDRLPFAIPGLNTGSLWEIETRQEYYAIDWPLRTRKNENGVYLDEGLIGWFPSASALITDIDVVGQP